ncbi:Hypothetical protein Nlim_1083 [Candidatus Nitrosarchaeum limnium SFB1]|jgi:hypothetical protein|uniref:Uncharacterized protein n=1 Tax=Candidatus Nitrosarchaeum limnium SFB1 TaxID=886738 RepID=F3KKQ9_9ARCH|nr:Hypothetical protein Nlim_1083 [Candidatus Nitrosarchaeum limnium SFB1]
MIKKLGIILPAIVFVLFPLGNASATTCTIDEPFCCDPLSKIPCTAVLINTIPGFEKIHGVCDPRINPSCPVCPQCIEQLRTIDLVTSLGYRVVQLEHKLDSMVLNQYVILASVFAGIATIAGMVITDGIRTRQRLPK